MDRTSKSQLRTARRACGGAIVEGAAALTVLLPVVILLVLAAMEISYAYVLKGSLTEAAREAARSLSIAYGQDPTIATNRSLQDSKVLTKIRIANVVNNEGQFDNPVFDTAADPPTVTVTVRYLSQQFGLPPFPNPDPLNLGSNFQLTGVSTYRLQ